MHAPGLAGEPCFTRPIDVSFVSANITTGVGRADYVLEMHGVMFACGADFDLAHQLVALVGTDRELVSVMRFPNSDFPPDVTVVGADCSFFRDCPEPAWYAQCLSKWHYGRRAVLS